jgi:hypothetical protein
LPGCCASTTIGWTSPSATDRHASGRYGIVVDVETDEDTVTPGADVDEVAPSVVDVGDLRTDPVDRGDVEVDVVDGREVEVVPVDDGAPGATVGSVVGSAVDAVRGTVVRGVTSNVADGDGDGDSGRTSRNTANVTAKIAINTVVDLRRRPRISSIPAPGCWSRGRGGG